MSKIIEYPEDEHIYGPLAYVDKEERERILSVPFGQFASEMKNLDRRIKEMKKKRKARAIT